MCIAKFKSFMNNGDENCKNSQYLCIEIALPVYKRISYMALVCCRHHECVDTGIMT